MRTEILIELDQFLGKMEGELDECNQLELSKRRITTILIKIVLLLMLCVGGMNTWYLYTLSTGLSTTLKEVDGMANGFAEITGTMVNISESMQAMDTQLIVMENITVDMNGITTNVSSISDTFTGITDVVSDMEGQIGVVEKSMGYMDDQMNYLTGNVHQIGNSMHTMSRPASFISNMMPW